MVLTYAEEVLGYIGGSLMAMGKGDPNLKFMYVHNTKLLSNCANFLSFHTFFSYLERKS